MRRAILTVCGMIGWGEGEGEGMVVLVDAITGYTLC